MAYMANKTDKQTLLAVLPPALYRWADELSSCLDVWRARAIGRKATARDLALAIVMAEAFIFCLIQLTGAPTFQILLILPVLASSCVIVGPWLFANALLVSVMHASSLLSFSDEGWLVQFARDLIPAAISYGAIAVFCAGSAKIIRKMHLNLMVLEDVIKDAYRSDPSDEI